MQYIEQPKQVEAFRYDPEPEPEPEPEPVWFQQACRNGQIYQHSAPFSDLSEMRIKTANGNGWMRLGSGEWVIKDAFGVLSVLSDSTFQQLYKPEQPEPPEPEPEPPELSDQASALLTLLKTTPNDQISREKLQDDLKVSTRSLQLYFKELEAAGIGKRVGRGDNFRFIFNE